MVRTQWRHWEAGRNDQSACNGLPSNRLERNSLSGEKLPNVGVILH
jgi:hypothetical protein